MFGERYGGIWGAGGDCMCVEVSWEASGLCVGSGLGLGVCSLVILYCRPLEWKRKDGFCSGAAT